MQTIVNSKGRELTEMEIIAKISKLVPGLTVKGLAYLFQDVKERLAEAKSEQEGDV